MNASLQTGHTNQEVILPPKRPLSPYIFFSQEVITASNCLATKAHQIEISLLEHKIDHENSVSLLDSPERR